MRKILVALFMFVISIQVFAAKDVINFGLIPTESSIVMEERTKPFLNEMEKFLGIKVKPFYAAITPFFAPLSHK
jgi:ABC-type phosphate/phosphonate transport system substrate-binding protein